MSIRIAGLVAVLVAVLESACTMSVSPLAAAARRGDLAEIDRLIAAGADPHAGSGVNEWPPLMHALHKNQKAAALRLMKESHAPSSELDRALAMAAGYAQADLVEALLRQGADPHRVDRNGDSTLALAVRGGFDIDVADAGCDAHAATVGALLAAAPDLRLEGERGEAALAAARERGCAGTLALLAAKTP